MQQRSPNYSYWHRNPGSQGTNEGTPGGESAFNANTVAGLVRWYDASYGTYTDAGITPATADGDLVGQWKDKSIFAANATQADPAKKLSLQLNEINGRPVLRGAAGTYMTMTSLAVDDFTLIWAGNWGDNSSSIIGDGVDGFWYLPAANLMQFRPGGAGLVSFTLSPTRLASTRAIWVIRRNGITHDIRINGANGATVASVDGVNTVTALTMLFSHRIALHNFQGDCAEFLAFNDNLSASDMRKVETYLSEKYGIPLV